MYYGFLKFHFVVIRAAPSSEWGRRLTRYAYTEAGSVRTMDQTLPTGDAEWPSG